MTISPILFQLLLLFQNSPDPAFDDLAGRAAAAIDSRPDEALTLYRQALALRPSWAEGWFYSGASLYQLGRYAEAKEALLKGVALAPRKGTPLGLLGLCEYELGDYDRALDHIRKSEALGLADNKEFVSAVRNRAALIYLRHSDFRRAVEQLRPLATVGSDPPAIIDALGVGVLAMTDLPANVPANKRGLVTLAGRAAWAFFAQRPEEAQVAFQQLVEQYPNEPGVHYASGIFLLDRDPATALAEFRKELAIQPSHVTARLQIAFLELKSGDPAAALEMAQQALRIEPGNFLCLVAAGRASLGMGEPLRAIPSLEAAVKLAPENPQTHFFLEQAYRRAGRNADAQKEKAAFARLRSEQDPLTLPPAGLPVTAAVP